jgi:hypothetical protein
MPSSPNRPANFDEFWPIYVRAHSHQLNRTLHVIGTSLALACVLAAIVKRRPWVLLLAPVFGYGLGWCGHLVERSRPSSFSHPIYSVRANLRLWWKTIAGDMDAEVARILAESDSAEQRPVEPPQPAADMN